MEKPIYDKESLKKFVENNIKKSNFSTRNLEAFYNVKNTYYPVENNNNILSKKYLRGESKNGLLKFNSEKDIKNNKIINIDNNIKEEDFDNNIFNNDKIKITGNIELKPDEEENFELNKEDINNNI